MIRPIIGFFALFEILVSSCSSKAEESGSLVITNVRIIDVIERKLAESQMDILIKNQRIKKIIPSSDKAQFNNDILRIDGEGKYVIPGM